MARKKTPVELFRERLDELSHSCTEDLRLPGVEENRLEGYAYLFRLVLPLLNAHGKRVFTDPILDELFQLLPLAASFSSLRTTRGRLGRSLHEHSL